MSTTNLEKAATNGSVAISNSRLTAFRRTGAPAAVRVSLDRALPVIFELRWRQTASDAIDAKAASPDVAPRLGGLVGAGLENSADGRGVFKSYQHGWVMWREDLGALAVYGAIGARWNEIGGTTSGYGWPTTDELSTPRGPGRYNHFEGGSIYWSPNTGARFIYGAIRDLWASMAWEQGPLGLPTTDEEDVPGVGGARRNGFEGGVITWTPWAGARVTSLNVPAGTNPGGLTIQTHGGGGHAAPAPQVQRHVIVTANIALTDHETFGSNEHGSAQRRDERWVDSWDPQGVMTLVGTAGGEMRVEVVADAAVRPDGSVRVGVNVKLYEGTSVTTDDLDGERSTTQVVPRDQTVQIPIHIRNDDEGDDFADISLVISNTST